MREKAIAIADRVVEYSLYGLISFIPISIAAIEIFTSLAIIAFIVKKILCPDFEFIKSNTNLFLLLFLVFCGFSLLNSGHYIEKSLHALFFKWTKYIFIFLIMEDTLSSRKRILNVVGLLLAIGGVVAVDSLYQNFFGWEFLRGRNVIVITGHISRITGPFYYYNALAAYLICILALVMAAISIKGNSKFLSSSKNKVIFYILFFELILLYGSFLLTFSRGGWVGFLFASLLMLFLSRKWKFILSLFCLFMFAVIFVPALKERAVLTFTSIGDASRFAIWKGAWAMIKEHPFLGKGIGTFMANFSQYAKGLGIQYAHNCYLQIWAETGVFALLSFISFVSVLLWQGIKSFKKSNDYVMLGVLCSIFGFSVHSFFDTHLYSLQLAVLFWVFLGILASLLRQARHS